MEIGLFLMNQKGLKTLKRLLIMGFAKNISFVVGSKDINVIKDYYYEIRNLCLENGIIHFNRKEFNNITADYYIAIGWRWLINNTTNLIILHDSLLPKYRGFAPLVTSLINGEKTIGVTALFAAEKYDTGNIILQKKIEIEYPIKIFIAIEKIAELYGSIVCDIFTMLLKNEKLNSYEQNDKEASYSIWLDEEDYFINWEWDAEKIKRKVDAVGFPYKGAKTRMEGNIFTIKECEVIRDKKIENRSPGKIFGFYKKAPIVICGKGLLLLKEISDTNNNIIQITSLRKRFK